MLVRRHSMALQRRVATHLGASHLAAALQPVLHPTQFLRKVEGTPEPAMCTPWTRGILSALQGMSYGGLRFSCWRPGHAWYPSCVLQPHAALYVVASSAAMRWNETWECLKDGSHDVACIIYMF